MRACGSKMNPVLDLCVRALARASLTFFFCCCCRGAAPAARPPLAPPCPARASPRAFFFVRVGFARVGPWTGSRVDTVRQFR